MLINSSRKPQERFKIRTMDNISNFVNVLHFYDYFFYLVAIKKTPQIENNKSEHSHITDICFIVFTNRLEKYFEKEKMLHIGKH